MVERRGGGPREGWLWREGTDLECAVEMREDGGVGAGAGRAALVQQAIDAHLVGGPSRRGGEGGAPWRGSGGGVP